MSTEGDSPPQPGRLPGLSSPTLAIALLMIGPCLVELVLSAADHGYVGSLRWRSLAIQNGAFWAGLLKDWIPNYALQPATMFLTYSWLHAGLGHLLGNMAILLMLGRVVEEQLGPRRFLALYFLSGIGGGIGFAVLGSSVQPMVGASGAIFGLAGAWKQRDWAARRARGVSRMPVLVDVAGLAFLNVAFWFLEEGYLAWEAHLGGFVAGWVLAMLLSPAARPRSR